ncbi:hypothetical protein ABIC15_001718 [Exiguobacterium sp. PvP048]|uniref:hypothetical protein n=1 Tax=unclassified Exiguobacterium TaxID=2644629 RepID=UPI0033911BC5
MRSANVDFPACVLPTVNRTIRFIGQPAPSLRQGSSGFSRMSAGVPAGSADRL